MRLILSSLLLLLPLCAQPAHKNLKILKDDEVNPTMQSFRTGLGVQCGFCHVQDRSSDENPKKDVARMMLTMAREINAKFPADGKMRVTCYTCHRGSATPLTAPPPAAQ